MRRLIGAFALGVSAIGSSAAAQEEFKIPGPPDITDPSKREAVTGTEAPTRYWYVGGEFGAMIVEDINVDIGATNNAIVLNHDYGYDGGIFVGYDLGAFRIEGEVAYKKADLESYNTTIRLPLEGPLFAAGRDASGSSSALSFMINGMLDFGDDDGISGFVGGGIGMARVKANNYRNFANATPFLDGSDSKLAWQVFAGVRQRVSDNIDVTVKYRFFNADKVELLAFNGAESEHRFRSHSLLGGITFNFGKPISITETQTYCEVGWSLNPTTGKCERPTEVSIWRCRDDPRDYPTRPECRVEVYGPFIVFFDWDLWTRDDLKPQAIAVLDHAAAQYNQTGSVQVSIEAHTDTSGTEPYNEGLADRRLATVQAYLAEKGIPASAVVPRSFGERCPLVATADNVREPQNRRVEIWYGDRQIAPGECPPPPNQRID